jgi:hypothetical protein
MSGSFHLHVLLVYKLFVTFNKLTHKYYFHNSLLIWMIRSKLRAHTIK